jgi:hypothetical protein
MASLIDVIEKVRSRVLPDANDETIKKFDFIVEQVLPSALKEAALKVAESKDESVRAQLQKDFTAALTTGKADMSGLLSAAEPLLLRFPFPRISHSTLTYPLQPVPSLFRLQIQPTVTDWGFYALENAKIHTKDTNGSLTGLTGNLTITGNFVPTLANLPNPLLPLVVEEIVSAVKGISFESETQPLLELYPRATGNTE